MTETNYNYNCLNCGANYGVNKYNECKLCNVIGANGKPTKWKLLEQYNFKEQGNAATAKHYQIADIQPIEINELGGKQSKIKYKWTDFHPKVMLRIAARSHMGFTEYGSKNYLNVPIDDHIDHALTHIYNFLDGNMQDGDELAGAVCRLLFVMEIDQRK